MPPMAVYEVATFYNMYDLKPVGVHKMTVCTNLPCALQGGEQACAEYLKEEAGHRFQRNHADGRFTLKEGECMGACGDAPAMLVNNKRMCSFMTREARRAARRAQMKARDRTSRHPACLRPASTATTGASPITSSAAAMRR
jgi:NADH:ubiquinone oxidoreductase subunit E